MGRDGGLVRNGRRDSLPPVVTQGRPERPPPHGETIRVAPAPRNSDNQDPRRESRRNRTESMHTDVW